MTREVYLEFLTDKFDQFYLRMLHEVNHSTIDPEKTLVRGETKLKKILDQIEKVKLNSESSFCLDLNFDHLPVMVTDGLVNDFGSGSAVVSARKLKLNLQPEVDLDLFSSRFVRGGLLLFNPGRRYQVNLPLTGQIPGLSKDEPKFSKPYRVKLQNFIGQRKLRLAVDRVASLVPRRKRRRRSYRERRRSGRRRRVVRVYRYKINLPSVKDLKKKYSYTKINALPDVRLTRWWKLYRRLPPDFLTSYGWSVFTKHQTLRLVDRILLSFAPRNAGQTPKKLTFTRSRYRRRRRRRGYSRYRYYGGYISRFKTNFGNRADSDPLRVRYDWFNRYGGSVLSQREVMVSENSSTLLDCRWSILKSHKLQLSSFRGRITSHAGYSQLLFFGNNSIRPRLMVDSNWLDYLQRRKLRLRRFVDQSLTFNGYLFRVTGRSFQTYRFNRSSLIEFDQSLSSRSYIVYAEELLKIKRKYNTYSKQNSWLTYNYFKRDGSTRYRTHTQDFARFRGYFKRLVPLGKHRQWRKYHRRAQRLKANFVKSSLVSELVKSSQTTEQSLKPEKYGIYSSIFSSTLDTKRKLNISLTDRQMNSIFRSFRSGLVVDQLPFNSLIGNVFNFNRRTLLGEKEFGSNFQTPKFSFRRRRRRSFFSISRFKLWWWFKVFTPLWWVYFYLSRFWDQILTRLYREITFVWDLTFTVRAGLIQVYRLARQSLTRVRFENLIYRRLQTTDYYRKWSWVYHSWLFAYVMENDYENIDRRDFDFSLSPSYSEDGMDWSGDEGEEFGTDGSAVHQFDEEQPPSRFFFDSPLFSIYDEEKFLFETPLEIVTDEFNYYFKLCLTPFVDFFLRGPIWGGIELLTNLQLMTKVHLQQKWFNYLKTKSGFFGERLKKGLIFAKVMSQSFLWVLTSLYLFNFLTFDDVKILVTYEFGFTWYDEFYVVWLWLSLVGGYLLWAPVSVVNFVRRLGFDNWLFILGSQISLAEPEGDQPERNLTKLSQNYLSHHLDRTTGIDLMFSFEDRNPYQQFGGLELNQNKFYPFSYDRQRLVIARDLIPVHSYIGREEQYECGPGYLDEDRPDEWWTGPNLVSTVGQSWVYRWDQLYPLNLNSQMFRDRVAARDVLRPNFLSTNGDDEQYEMNNLPEYTQRYYRKVESPTYYR